MPDAGPTVPFVTGSWNGDGVILFSIGGENGYLSRVPATGGASEPLTSSTRSAATTITAGRSCSPGGRLLLFVRTNDADTTGVYAGGVTAVARHAVLARLVSRGVCRRPAALDDRGPLRRAAFDVRT